MNIEISIPEKHIELMHLMKQGYTTKEIASKTNIHEKTIKRIKAIYITQFGCRNTTHLVATLIEKKIV